MQYKRSQMSTNFYRVRNLGDRGGKRLDSGRPAKFENKTIEQILRLAAVNVLRFLRSEDFTLKDKAELGSKFIIKRMPVALESDGSFAPKTIVLLRNEKAIEENAGHDRTTA